MDDLRSGVTEGEAFGFSVIPGSVVSRILSAEREACVATVRGAYLAHAAGKTVNPPSLFLRFDDKPSARIIALPSHLQEPWPISGIKWISSYPENTRQGIPRASAVLILNNHENGYPLACIEASIISAARTAASAVLAARHLSPRGCRATTLGIIGTGFIARYIYQFLMGTGWQIDNVRLFDLDAATAQRFATRFCDPKQHHSVTVVPDLATAVQESDFVVFATIAGKPHVYDPALFHHNPVILHISLRDLAPELLLNACNIVDDVEHVMHADTSPHLAEKLTGGRDFITGTLSDVIEGRCSADRTRPTIFSPFGLGVLDLAVGKWIYDRALATGEHVMINQFFHDLDR